MEGSFFSRFSDAGFKRKEIDECLLKTAKEHGIGISEVGRIIDMYEDFSRVRLVAKYGPKPAKDIFANIAKYEDEIAWRIDSFIEKNVPSKIREKFFEIFWNAVKEKSSEVPVLEQLRGLYLTSKPKKKSGGRAASRVRDIQKWLKPLQRRGVKYLDVGCSEASITGAITSALDLKHGEAYGCDIFIARTEEGVVQFSKSSPTSLPYGDNEFDLVTTFQALHHFTDPYIMLSEIHRVLKPGGVYIIREHDVRTEAFGVYLDVVHALYVTVFGDEETPSQFRDTYQSFYHSKEVWSENYIEPAGFKFGGLRKTNDRFNSYYARYFKIK